MCSDLALRRSLRAESPVFGVPRGSIRRMCASSSATGQCSTPRGTTKSSPSPSSSVPVAQLDRQPPLEDEEEVVRVGASTRRTRP